jgi:hypothetical protein
VFGLLPPGAKNAWEDNNAIIQADFLAYSMIRDNERREEQIELYKILGAKIG